MFVSGIKRMVNNSKAATEHKRNWIDLAVEVAARAHRHQLRKGTDIPYIVHPIGVGLILIRAGCPEEVVAAGILHDILEDTPVTYEYLRDNFNERIADLVTACSEPDRSLSWEERKQHTLEFIKTAPLEVRTIVCADKLHNLRSIAADYRKIGEELWKRFKRGRPEQEWYYRSVAETLCDGFENNAPLPLFRQLKQEADVFFKSIA